MFIFIARFIDLEFKCILLDSSMGSSSTNASSVYWRTMYVRYGLVSAAAFVFHLSSAPIQPLHVSTNQSRAATPENKQILNIKPNLEKYSFITYIVCVCLCNNVSTSELWFTHPLNVWLNYWTNAKQVVYLPGSAVMTYWPFSNDSGLF